MNLQDAKNEALRLMSLHGLTQGGWRFEFNKRKMAAGLCNHTKKIIFLSVYYTQAGSVADVTDTILHESAHALTPGHGHDGVWRRKALEIGCVAQRCVDLKVKPSYAGVRDSTAAYKAVCINGHEHFRHKRPKRDRSCGKCSPRFDTKYLLEYKRVDVKEHTIARVVGDYKMSADPQILAA